MRLKRQWVIEPLYLVVQKQLKIPTSHSMRLKLVEVVEGIIHGDIILKIPTSHSMRLKLAGAIGRELLRDQLEP